MGNELEIRKFNYATVNKETADFLQIKELRMKSLSSTFYTELGRELKEAQDELARHGYGCFEEWYSSLGLKKDTVYRLIQRYDLIVANCDGQKLIEELPLSLSYEISKPSAPIEIIEKVLSGDITTNKQYQDAIKAKKEAEQKINSLEELLEQEQNRLPIEKIIEKTVDKTDYKTIAELKGQLTSKDSSIERLRRDKELLERKVKLNEEDAKKYTDLKTQIEFLNKEKLDLGRQIQSATELSGLVVKIENMLKTELAPIRYSRTLERMDSDVAIENLTDIIESVESWCYEMRKFLPNNKNNIIEMGIIE